MTSMIPAVAPGDDATPLEGRKMRLMVGNERRMFFLTQSGLLSDWRSGYYVCSIYSASYRIAWNAVAVGKKYADPARAAAQMAVQQIVDKVGAEKVLNLMNSKPQINS